MKTRLAALGAVLVALATTVACAPGPTSAPASVETSVSAVPLPVGSVRDPLAVRVKLARVVDGDTVHVTLPDGSDETVRLIGVNAPETTKGHHDCGGQQATDRLAALLAGGELTIAADPTQAGRDRYGRAIRYLDRPDGTDVQLVLISEGLAQQVQYAARYQRQPQYVAAEQQARADQVGGWAPVAAGGCGWGPP